MSPERDRIEILMMMDHTQGVEIAWEDTCNDLGAASAVPFRVAFRVA